MTGKIWSRLEPSARAELVTEAGLVQPDLEPGLQTRIADPLWMLARQWQLGEFRGEDAASPVRVRVEVRTTRPTSFEGNGATHTLPAHGMLLEPHVEAEALTSSAGAFGRNAEAGLHLLRLLDAEGVGTLRAKFRVKYPLTAPTMSALVDAETRRRVALLTRTSLDAKALAAAHDASPSSALPAGLTTVQISKAGAAIATWRAWLAVRFLEPGPAGSTWKSSRMEYAFRLAAQAPQGTVKLAAQAYPGGHLDWHSFDLIPAALQPNDTAPLTTTSIEVLPTSVRFRGMPAQRLWSFEEGGVNFAAVAAGPTEAARLLVAEFGIVFGDDWYVAPLALTANTLVRVTKVEVIDTFGGVTSLRSCAEEDGVDRTWRFFELTGDDSVNRGIAPWLYIAPAVVGGMKGSVVERVMLARDEGANLAWAIESVIEDPLGLPIDRTQAARRSPAAETSASWSYRAESRVPPNWIPLVPVQSGGRAQYLLRRGKMQQWGSDPAAGVQGTLLAGRALDIREEEVPSEGVVITRAWQSARSSDGSLLVWLGRHKRVGRGEARSGLRFDRILGTADQSPPTRGAIEGRVPGSEE